MQFTTKRVTEYFILRDYYVSNNHLQGIFFVLQDSKGEIVNKFLMKQLIQNKKTWTKKGSIFNVSYQQLRFERGNSNMLVIEEGELFINSKKGKKAERISFFLKHD